MCSYVLKNGSRKVLKAFVPIIKLLWFCKSRKRSRFGRNTKYHTIVFNLGLSPLRPLFAEAAPCDGL